MKLFKIIAIVECETIEQARIVAAERTGFDELYDGPDGKPFDYQFRTVEVKKQT